MDTSLEKENRARIHRAVRYIEKHLASPLSVDELSSVSAYSPHHFHRLFKKTMNENVMHFINRLRVEKAAKLLVFSERGLLDIALDCGLQSPAAKPVFMG